jgi:HD-GYP domain-containing protein (c-di-GMP phosphodiesterase class II)
VTVDIKKSSLDSSLIETAWHRGRDQIAKHKKNSGGVSQVYENVVATQEEAPKALSAYDTAIDGMELVIDSVAKGGALSFDQVQEAVTPMIDSVVRNQDAMAWLAYLRKRDEYAYNHSIAVSVWAVILGRHLGLDRDALDALATGGMLLDIGRVKVPQAIQDKQGVLTADEMDVMRRHVLYGLAIAKETPGINREVLAMIGCHHERHDGTGYPFGLKGAKIPLFGRIAAIVDCFDAMITHRSYAAAKSSYNAVRELNQLSGTEFQRELVEQFVQALGMFPTGSLVELNTGEVGIVIEQNRIRRLRPKVMILMDEDKQAVVDSRTLDLRDMSSDSNDPDARWITGGHEPGAFGIDPKDYFL